MNKLRISTKRKYLKNRFWKWRIQCLNRKIHYRDLTSYLTKQKKKMSKFKTSHLKLYNWEQKEKKKKKKEKEWRKPKGLSKGLIYTLWESQKEKKEKGAESLFKTIMAPNFPNLGEEISSWNIRNSEEDPKKWILKNIIIKLSNVKEKDFWKQQEKCDLSHTCEYP